MKRRTHCPKGHELSGANLRLVGPSINRPTGHRKCRQCERDRGQRTRQRRAGELATYMRGWKAALKLEVLTRYGKDGHLQCAWPDCVVTDVDMLTLDHVNDDGAHNRRLDRSWGRDFYARVKRHGYPAGFQTLCMNHQLKKEILRKRTIAQEHVA